MLPNNRTLTKWEPESNKTQSTLIWRSQIVPMRLRNDDVWSNSGTLINERNKKESEKKAKRNKTLGKIVAGAVGAALVVAAIHEWEKHKESKEEKENPRNEQRMPGEYFTSHHHSSSNK